jgi:hypothetical protein
MQLEPERAPIYWSHEAITYLGLDRLGLARPDMALQRLIKKGALRPRKIGGHLAFDRGELDTVASRGDQVRRPGRPKRNLHSEAILRRENPANE